MPWFNDSRGAPVNASHDDDCWRSGSGRHEWEDVDRLRNGMVEKSCAACGLTRWFPKEDVE